MNLPKAFWNRVINALALIFFCFMISTGMILKYILPPGSGRAEGLFGGGGHRQRGAQLLLDMDRHEWGEIHFYLALGFLGLLLVHLILHWSWIRVTAWGTPQCPQPWHRKAITLFILFLIAVSLLVPWFLAAA